MSRRPASVEVLASLAKVLRPRKIRWYVFGAQAAVFYGSPRMTMDVDVTIAVPAERVWPLSRPSIPWWRDPPSRCVSVVPSDRWPTASSACPT